MFPESNLVSFQQFLNGAGCKGIVSISDALLNAIKSLYDIGIGCVWIAIYPLEERVETCRRILGIPDSITPFALLAMGVPNEVLAPEYRYDEERLHQNKW